MLVRLALAREMIGRAHAVLDSLENGGNGRPAAAAASAAPTGKLVCFSVAFRRRQLLLCWTHGGLLMSVHFIEIVYGWPPESTRKSNLLNLVWLG